MIFNSIDSFQENFDPKDLKKPLLTVKSAPFKVYARKPTLQEEEKKRKLEQEEEEEEKKRKFEQGSLKEYFEHLEGLIQCSQHLEENERKPALDDAIHKLVSVEPNSELIRSTNFLPPSKRRFLSNEK
jgi:hypothetical protein